MSCGIATANCDLVTNAVSKPFVNYKGNDLTTAWTGAFGTYVEAGTRPACWGDCDDNSDC
jgi:hypothetical protein